MVLLITCGRNEEKEKKRKWDEKEEGIKAYIYII